MGGGSIVVEVLTGIQKAIWMETCCEVNGLMVGELPGLLMGWVLGRFEGGSEGDLDGDLLGTL
jgi:hypothetical protein